MLQGGLNDQGILKHSFNNLHHSCNHMMGWKTLSEFGTATGLGSLVDLLEAELLERPEEVQQGQVQGPTSMITLCNRPGWGGHKLPPNQKCLFAAVKVNLPLGGFCKNAASRTRSVIPALSLALVRQCLGSESSLRVPCTRQRMTDRYRGTTPSWSSGHGRRG